MIQFILPRASGGGKHGAFCKIIQFDSTVDKQVLDLQTLRRTLETFIFETFKFYEVRIRFKAYPLHYRKLRFTVHKIVLVEELMIKLLESSKHRSMVLVVCRSQRKFNRMKKQSYLVQNFDNFYLNLQFQGT